MLSYDHYCIRPGEKVTPEYFENLEIIRAAAINHKKPFWAFALTTPLRPSFLVPTEGHLRFQLYCSLAYGARGLQYFTYCHVHVDGIIDEDGNRTDAYDLARQINWEIQHLGTVLLGLKSTAVLHTGPLPRGTRLFEGHGGLLSCTGAPAVLGFFDGPNGRKHLMVVNRDPVNSAGLTLKFADAIKNVGLFDRLQKDGRLRMVNLAGGELKLKLTAGDGRLLQMNTALDTTAPSHH